MRLPWYYIQHYAAAAAAALLLYLLDLILKTMIYDVDRRGKERKWATFVVCSLTRSFFLCSKTEAGGDDDDDEDDDDDGVGIWERRNERWRGVASEIITVNATRFMSFKCKIRSGGTFGLLSFFRLLACVLAFI